MALSKDDKDEIRELVYAEISKAFKAGLSAATNISVMPGEDRTKQDERKKRTAVIKEVGRAIKITLEGLSIDAHAAVVAKTDPERAKTIRALKPEW